MPVKVTNQRSNVVGLKKKSPASATGSASSLNRTEASKKTASRSKLSTPRSSSANLSKPKAKECVCGICTCGSHKSFCTKYQANVTLNANHDPFSGHSENHDRYVQHKLPEKVVVRFRLLLVCAIARSMATQPNRAHAQIKK
jgi:hypothetical protein